MAEEIILSSDVEARKQQALFLKMCSSQFTAAISDSQTEMDALTSVMMSDSGFDSADALVRLQSIDRLMQRLTNANNNIQRLEHFLLENTADPRNGNWTAFLTKTASEFKMEQERELFRHFFDVPVDRDNDSATLLF